MPQPLKTFIIYAREDRDALLELKKQLIPLERREQIAVWYDGEIVAGQEWGVAIQTNLQAADIILLLLSSDFFASDYIEKEELKEALARHENGQSVVVPVVVRHCIWQEHPEIQKLQVLPEGAAPVFSKKHWDSPDEALANVAQGIARISKNRRGAGDVEKEPAATPSMPGSAVAAPPSAAVRLSTLDLQKMEPLPSPTSLSCMVRIKGGTFTMGSPEHEDGRFDNEVQHQVTIADFEIGRYPVTQQLWQEIMETNPSQFKGDKLPVESMIWDEVQEFLKKLNARYPGRNYRLPTEAEWEYAARGGNQSQGFLYAGSDNLDEVAWHAGNAGSKTQPVGQKKSNELGLCDLTGNVWEWCADWYGNYPTQPQTNPGGPASGTYRIRRGGSWNNGPQKCRVAYRYYWLPDGRNAHLGFRLASSPL